MHCLKILIPKQVIRFPVMLRKSDLYFNIVLSLLTDWITFPKRQNFDMCSPYQNIIFKDQILKIANNSRVCGRGKLEGPYPSCV